MRNSVLLLIILTLIITSCGGDKQSQLAKLKKERDLLNQKIATLEQDLMANDSTYEVAPVGKLISVEEITPVTFEHFIEVQGKLDGDENLAVYAETMGLVKTVNVKAGDYVTKGQILAQLDDEIIRDQLKSLETNLAFVVDLYNKQKTLWDQKIGSEVQYLDAKNKKESIENQRKTLLKQIDMMKIKAPISGTVEEVTLRVGQMAAPQMASFRMVNFDDLKITAEVSEAYSNHIQLGDLVKVYLPDANTEVSAKVDFSSKYINPVNRTFMIEAHFTTQSIGLKANMVAVLKINDYRADSAIVIPINYVKTDQQGSYLMTVVGDQKQQKAKKVYFVPGISYNGMMEVKSGLSSGMKFITAGFLNVDDGEIVRF